MATTKNEVFSKLANINVNGHTEVKESGGVKLTYLSWSWAWKAVKETYPDANYEIVKFDGIPYAYDPNTGYMVYTKVTIEGITHEMWLPVMDSNNRAMKAEPYEVKTKYRSFTVASATMFDVNKTIMRCLVKNLAMFGLGLYIYAGEDLPDSGDEAEVVPVKQEKKPAPKKSAPKTEPKNEDDVVPMCVHCLKPIPAHDEYTPEQVASLTMHNLKKQLCWDCAHDYQEKIKEAQAKKMAEDAKANAPEPEYVIDEQTNLPFPMEN